MVAILILSLALFSGATLAVPTPSANVLELNPSVVQVEFFTSWGSPSWTQSCGASVLNSLYMMSAASCFSGPSYSPLVRRFRAGANYRNIGGIIVNVQREINYPNFNRTTLANDVSVIRLASRISFSPVIQQLAISAQGSVLPHGLQINQIGWGVQNNTRALISAPVFLVTPNQTWTNDSVLRATPSQAAVYSGDVGGPWIWHSITIGVVSGLNQFGKNTNSSIIAGFVASYANWIVRTAV